MMLKFGVFLLFLSLLQCASASTEQTLLNPHFRISYSGSLEGEVYARFIKRVYAELGFKVSIIHTPVKRGLMLLNNEIVDADVIRLKSVVAKFDNVILVEPAIAKGYLVLLCHKDKPCDLSILQLKTAHIQSDEGNINLFKPGELKAQILINEMPSNTLNMLEEARIFYALYSIDSRTLEKLSSKFNYVKLKDVSGYHVINKKHAHLLPKIQQKLQELLPDFHANL
jgi:hypothetical protein